MDSNSLKPICAGLLSCLLITACGDGTVPTPETSSAASGIPDAGRRLTLVPEQAWARDECGSRTLPFMRVERTEVVPAKVRRGSSFIYRFPYVACVNPRPGYLLGRFRTTVFFGKKKVSTRTDETYPIETGGWSIDTEIFVPKEATPGEYMIEGSFTTKALTVQDRLNFIIEP